MKLIDNRISLAGDFYIETTKDLVSSVDIPMANGFTSYIENIGKMRNRGYELKATVFVVRNSDRELSWSVTGGLIHNENKILEVSEALQEHKRIWKPIRGLIPICCIKQDILLIRFGWYAPWVLIRVPVGSCIWIVSVNRPLPGIPGI